MPRPAYHTVVVKIGTGLLTHGSQALNRDVITGIVEQVSRLHKAGLNIVIVTSGAVGAGRHLLGESEGSVDVVQWQALAAVGQVLLMQTYSELFEAHTPPIRVAQAMLTRRDILGSRLSYLNARNTLQALLGRRVIPIVNENDVVAVEELAGEVFGDNDNLSSHVANLLDADLLVMLGELTGLYSTDPNLNPDNARLIPVVTDIDGAIREMAGPSHDGKGRGGMVTKLEAAKLPTASGTDVVISSGLADNVLERLTSGEFGTGANRLCTLIPATGSKTESRKRWIAAGRSRTGHIVVDDGATLALVNRNRSLLPAGVTRVDGEFERGDTISIRNSSHEIAAGVSNYSSSELDRIKGAQSDEIEGILGYQYGQEAVHRNNMMVLRQDI